MGPRAFLEKTGEEWLDEFVYLSRFPLERIGYKIVPFEVSSRECEEYFHRKNIRTGDIIVGSVETSVAFFKALNTPIPPSISYHEEVFPFLFRTPVIQKIGELDKEFPYFIKPSEEIKLFTGSVIENQSQLDLLLKFYDGVTVETKVWKSPVVDFVSEYRCFINQGELRGIKHYKGDFESFPDISFIKEIISAYKSSPISYTIDVGIDTTGKTILVELNDMWAIGSYGLDGTIYTKCLRDRIHQITGYGVRTY
jgi:hypothetical protein